MPAPLLNAANAITAARGLLVLAVAAAGLASDTPGTAGLVVAIGTVAALLDLADGWVARRSGTATAFGARFDMEVDALLILVLSALVWRFGITGPWVLASGLMRYLFVALARPLPWLARPLPPEPAPADRVRGADRGAARGPGADHAGAARRAGRRGRPGGARLVVRGRRRVAGCPAVTAGQGRQAL